MKLQYLFLLLLAAPTLLRLLSGTSSQTQPAAEPPAASRQTAPAEPAKSNPQPAKPAKEAAGSDASRPANSDHQERR